MISVEEARRHLTNLPGWELSPDSKAIRKTYNMKGFTAAVRLIGQIAPVAEEQDHHPDLHLTGYRRLTVELSTHSIGGLSDKDFTLAARIEALPKELKPSP